MKKGIAGVRLCDTPGCYDRWPCDRHGTLLVGRLPGHPLVPMPALVPGAALVRVGGTNWGNELMDDIKCDVKCLFCGYAVCSCPKTQMAERLELAVNREQQTRKALLSALESMTLTYPGEAPAEERVPEGWEKIVKGYIHQTLPMAVRPRKDGWWTWRVGDDDSQYQTGVCKTQYRAMEKAEEVYEEESEDQDVPDGWEVRGCGCCWARRDDSARVSNAACGVFTYSIRKAAIHSAFSESPEFETLAAACEAADAACRALERDSVCLPAGWTSSGDMLARAMPEGFWYVVRTDNDGWSWYRSVKEGSTALSVATSLQKAVDLAELDRQQYYMLIPTPSGQTPAWYTISGPAVESAGRITVMSTLSTSDGTLPWMKY